MDVTSRRHPRGGDGWPSWTLEQPHFTFWCLCYFFVFLLFASYGVSFVVLHGVLAARSKVCGWALFSGFSLVVRWKQCRVIEWRMGCLVVERNKYQTSMKAKHSSFWTLIDLNLVIVVKSFQDECLKLIVWMCCSFCFIIFVVLKLVSITLGIKELVGTLRQKWWEAQGGL
jgi:hypothetical protein